ncbi:uncharacterized protein C14orf93 [Fundulus heteroclitus]|uniref:uncharacterized protein C14orf93 n=1 Tax=Fundulus heteroclitus TaxID=8078 RepID=UPI00165C0251|nr:uncharacterized protein C14orf93 [Fundulus heteroclitus]
MNRTRPPVRPIMRRYAGALDMPSQKTHCGRKLRRVQLRVEREERGCWNRDSVLADDEVELWKSATVDLMSDEDGVVGGVSGWIVRPPSFGRPDLSELCVKL